MSLQYMVGPYGAIIPNLHGQEVEWLPTPFGQRVPKILCKKDNGAVGLMGGTFDPIHYGHLLAAEEARCSLGLDQIVFIPSGRPPHKKDKKISPPQDRLAMTWLATLSNPYFLVSGVEIERPGYSYAIDTVRCFREGFGERAQLFFITGADAILEILSWKQVEELVSMCRFVAVTRPGFPLAVLQAKMEELLPAYCRERITTMEIPALAISATEIRERVAQGRSIKYLLPAEVENYIREKGLFDSTS